MRLILRPGHGLTYRGHHWTLQRPSSREDDWTAQYCGEHLIPALVRHGHCVYCLRAVDPVTGELDETPTTVDSSVLPWIEPGEGTTKPRWMFNASVEGALRGVRSCRIERTTHDPLAACAWEAGIPDSGNREMYLSIHQNWVDSPHPHGFIALHHPNSRGGKGYASKIWEAYAGELPGDHGKWAGYRPYSLWELYRTRRPAVLIEMGFWSNLEDRATMNDPDWRARSADAIARGLASAER